MLDIISIGDATLDTFVRVHDATVSCTLDRKQCQLCFNYAEKIPIQRLDQTLGGNALNNAVGSARLGLAAAFYSVIGNDETGKRVVRELEREQVGQKYLDIHRGSSTNYSIVLNYKAERTILQYAHPRTYHLPQFEKTKWIYYTAIGRKFAELETHLLHTCRDLRAKLAFNPGTGQIRQGIKKLARVFKHAEVVFVNKEEAEELVGDSVDIKGLMWKLRRYGPDIVVVTDGPNGAYALNGVHRMYLPIFPVKAVERTGAGDAFATGFVAAISCGESVAEAMRWGAANSASVVTKIGPQAGLLRKTEMAQWLRKYKHIQPKMIL